MDAAGNPDAAHGVQQFIVGTGGAGLSTPAARLSTSRALDSSTHGVIRLVLHDGSYSWRVPARHGRRLHRLEARRLSLGAPVEHTPPTTTIACNGAPCLAGGTATAPR